jgi:hypothetical protein
MYGNVSVRLFGILILALCLTGPAVAQSVLGPSGIYLENFNSMGAAGTTPPTGWQVFQITGGSGTWINNTGSNSMPAIGEIPDGPAVAAGTASAGLVANNNPTGNQVNGYNAIGVGGVASDRAIATAPTGIAGSVIELHLTNNTGAAVPGIFLSYDTRRIQVGADVAARTPGAGIPEGQDELPGYWVFYSLDGNDFTAVESLIPVGEGPSSNPIVPNTLGVTSVLNREVTLATPWAAGADLFLRFVDDNAIDPSPDQIIGIDNVRVAAVPEPSSLILLAVLMTVGSVFIRRRSQRAA